MTTYSGNQFHLILFCYIYLSYLSIPKLGIGDTLPHELLRFLPCGEIAHVVEPHRFYKSMFPHSVLFQIASFKCKYSFHNSEINLFEISFFCHSSLPITFARRASNLFRIFAETSPVSRMAQWVGQ